MFLRLILIKSVRAASERWAPGRASPPYRCSARNGIHPGKRIPGPRYDVKSKYSYPFSGPFFPRYSLEIVLRFLFFHLFQYSYFHCVIFGQLLEFSCFDDLEGPAKPLPYLYSFINLMNLFGANLNFWYLSFFII